MEITKIKIKILIVHLWEIVINFLYKILKFIKINANIKVKINIKKIRIIIIKLPKIIENLI